MKLVPKFKFGHIIHKGESGLDVDALGIPGANFGALYKPKQYETLDPDLVKATDIENAKIESIFPTIISTNAPVTIPVTPPTKRVKTEADWLALANKFTGGAFKTYLDIIDWQTNNGLVGDGLFGRNSMNKWLELLSARKSGGTKPVEVADSKPATVVSLASLVTSPSDYGTLPQYSPNIPVNPMSQTFNPVIRTVTTPVITTNTANNTSTSNLSNTSTNSSVNTIDPNRINFNTNPNEVKWRDIVSALSKFWNKEYSWQSATPNYRRRVINR